MPSIIQRPEAAADLLEIWLHIAPQNLAAADRLADRIDSQCNRLAEMPRLGRARDDLAEGLRSFTMGNYVLFYVPLDDGIELIRVLHGARDFAQLFADE